MSLVGLIAALVKSNAIVTHFKAPGRLLLNIEPDLRSARMFANIRQGFLNDVQHLDLQVR